MKKFDIELNEEMVVEEMSRRGLDCEIIPVVKNNVKYRGIKYNIGDICPTLYLEHFEGRYDSLDEMFDAMEEAFRNSVVDMPEVNANSILDKEYVKDNVIPAIQRRMGTDDDLIAFKLEHFEDLEVYYRFILHSDNGGGASVKLLYSHLKTLGMTPEEVDKYAMKNLHKVSEYQSIARILAKRMNMDEEEIVSYETSYPMYVLSNKYGIFGASSILDYDLLEELCEKLGTTELVILPSSVHEVIVIPKNLAGTMSEMTDMVQTVNSQELELDEILSDHAYEWSLLV